MGDASDGKRDFFISYNKADLAWAKWVGATLEAAGYGILLSEWDAKGNFVTFMEEAHRRTEWTVALLSDNYHGSDFTAAEWTARFARDPAGREGTLIPVIVGPVSQRSLLDALIHADLLACGGDEQKARKLLLERVARAVEPDFAQKKRAQARTRGFPGRDAAAVPKPAAEKPRFPVPVHNLPLYNPDFVGREDVLGRLHELLTKEQGPAVLTQAITGLGGIGKTQTALAYCYRHLAEHVIVWWLRAERPETLGSQLALLAPHLGLDPATPDQAALVAQVVDVLGRRGGFLLVFDNLEEPDALPAFLPRTGGQVLITARQRDWHGRAHALPLDVMPEAEALELLTGTKDWAALADLEEAKALAEELGWLPLALAQARSFMRGGESFAGYRRLLKESRPVVLAEGRAHPDYPEPVAKTWDISIRAAEAKCRAARELLEILAFMAPEPLPRTVLGGLATAAPRPRGFFSRLFAKPKPILADAAERSRAVTALADLSLLRATTESLAVHRLVQAVTRDGLAPEIARERVESAVTLVNAALPRSTQEHTNWPAIGTLLPHALAVTAEAERLQAGLTAAATVLNETALYHYARAAYAEAEPLYVRAIAIDKKVYGPDHPEVATDLNNLAELYRATGRFAEAEPLMKGALAIREQALGTEHPDVAQSLNNLANLDLDTGRFAEAEPLYARALAILEKALGPEHPDVAQSLNNLANLDLDTGRFAEAEPLYARALAILEKALGPKYPHFGRVLANRAKLLAGLERIDEARSGFERALAILEAALGADHPWTTDARGALDRLDRAGES